MEERVPEHKREEGQKLWWGDERGYEKERLVHHWCPRQKQVETMLQKSGQPQLTGKKTLLSRQNGEVEHRMVEKYISLPRIYSISWPLTTGNEPT